MQRSSQSGHFQFLAVITNLGATDLARLHFTRRDAS